MAHYYLNPRPKNVRSEEEQRSGGGRRTERDLKQEMQRRRKEEAEAAKATERKGCGARAGDMDG